MTGAKRVASGSLTYCCAAYKQFRQWLWDRQLTSSPSSEKQLLMMLLT